MAIIIWCTTSIVWELISSFLTGSTSLVIGILLYGCTVAASRLFPNVQIVEVKKTVSPERDILKRIAEERSLSGREEEILLMLVQGRSRKTIAKALYISDGTAKSHISSIYRKFNVSTKDSLLAVVEECKMDCLPLE